MQGCCEHTVSSHLPAPAERGTGLQLPMLGAHRHRARCRQPKLPSSLVPGQRSQHLLPAAGGTPQHVPHPSPDGSECAAHLGQALLGARGAAEDALRLLRCALRLREAGAQAGAPSAPGQQHAGVAQGRLVQAQAQALDVTVVGMEAGVAGLAAGVGAAVVALALVAAGAGDAWAAEAAACGFVTPRALRALEVAVALW